MPNGHTEPDIQPNFTLEERDLPYQKITIKKMPESLYKELEKRASAYTLSVPVYCRGVLECAKSNKSLYTGRVKHRLSKKVIAEEINIPVKGKAFLTDLDKWQPYGHRARSKMALAILTRHLDVVSW